MDKNDPIDMNDAPEIVFRRGKRSELKFRVPELAAKQAGKVCDVVYDMMQIFASIAASMEIKEAPRVRITEEHFTKMLDVVFYGICRNYPEWTREKLDDAPIGMLELIAACMTIARQAGMFPEKIEGAPDPLSAGAATAPTGEPSLPRSQFEPAGPSTT